MFYVTNCYTLVQGEYVQVVVKKKKKTLPMISLSL